MTTSDPFRGKTPEELSCLITIAKQIADEHERRKSEPSLLRSQYHLPLNYSLALEVWTAYKVNEEKKVESDQPTLNK